MMTINPRFTPGPWFQHEGRVLSASNDVIVQRLPLPWSGVDRSEEQAANVRLLLAAPTMAALLDEILVSGCDGDTRRRVQDVLASL